MAKKKKIIILGAGITGLVTAYYFSLDKDFEVTLIEKNKYVGGTSIAFDHKGFILDYGPHKLYTELPGIMEEISRVTPILKVKKKNSIYLKDNFHDFPLKFSQIIQKMPLTAFNVGVDIIKKSMKQLPNDSYENYLINSFGGTLYDLSFKDYAKKVWGNDPRDLDKELAISRVAVGSIFKLIKGMIFKDTKKISVDYFYYPPKGIKQLLDNLVNEIKKNNGKIISGREISSISISSNKVKSIKLGNKIVSADYLISTIYLDVLLNYIKGKKVPLEVLSSSRELSYQQSNVIYFILNKKRILKDCWVFFPEGKFLFHRISEQNAFSKYTSPPDKTCLMVETTKETSKRNIQIIIDQLEKIGIFKENEIIESFSKNNNRVYPIYKKGFSSPLSKVIDYIEGIENFYTHGRNGLFKYNSIDQCWDMSIKLFNQIKNNKSKTDWKNTKKSFDKYRIVD